MRVDDLSVGMFVAISEYIGGGSYDPWSGQRVSVQIPCPGKPWKIAGISLPFVLLDDGTHASTIDTRVWGLVRILPEYARACDKICQRGAESRNGERIESVSVFGRKPRKKKEKPNPRACPRCRNPHTVERVKVLGTGDWRRYCKECGWHDDGPGAQTARPKSPGLIE